jgi:urease accessory protein
VVFFLGAALPASALAHTGGDAHGFIAGALHPLSGVDHLLAMLAVGLLAGISGGRTRWLLPASFVVAMGTGALLGASGIYLPLIEGVIALSLIVFGLALAAKRLLSAPALFALTIGFAVFHGHAHGTEMGVGLSATTYGIGFLLATALLHGVGVLLVTRSLLPLSRPTLLSWSGNAIAVVGVCSLGALIL